MLKFRITLRRYFDTSVSKGPIRLFFSSQQDTEVVEVGEDRILDITLSQDDVAKLKNDSMQSDGIVAIENFITHQLGYGSSWHSWDIYNHFVVSNIRQLTDV